MTGDNEHELLASMQPALVRRWVAESASPPSRTIDGTVVSADISGFTRLAESLVDAGPRAAAENLNATINRCFDPMIDEIVGRGGDVLKFGGDALFALFDGADHPLQAAAAATKMQALLAAAEVDLDPPLSMTVGVASGPIELVLAGTERRELVVHGATVDECLRLESDAEPGETLVSATTAAELTPDWLDTDDPEVILLVGPPNDQHQPLPPARQEPGGEAIDWTVVLGPELASAVAAFTGSEGELRVVTVAFVDLPTAELDDRVVFDTVTRADRICRHHGVTLLSSDVNRGGIKLLLAAGAPTAGDADEDAMLGALVDLVHDPGAPPMRAGVNRGLVYAGFLGSAICRTLTVMGDPTNLAARLLGKAEPGGIAVSLPVLDNARAIYPTTELPPILVKGRLAPVTVHRLDGRAQGIRSADADLPLIGRTAERQRLRSAVDELRQGRGSTVELVGESGLGASRLLDATVEDLPAGMLHLGVEARFGGDRPYRAVQTLLRSLAGLDRFDADGGGGGDESAGTRQTETLLSETLLAWIERCIPDALPLAPLVAPALGLRLDPTEESEAIEPAFRQERAVRLLVDLLSASLAAPTVFVVDQAHRLDPASFELCRAIAAACADRPWVVMASNRPDHPQLTADEPLQLRPLGADDTRELVAAIGDLPTERRAVVADRSGGNPWFAVELARAEIDGVASGHDLSSIEAVITARIDRLGHELRLLVRLAAVLGRRFSLPVLRQVLDADQVDGGASFQLFADALPRLDRLIENDGERGDGWYRFRSGAIHQAAYGGLSTRRRRHLHRLVAVELEVMVGEAGELSWHYEQAGDDQRCWRTSLEAAKAAKKLGLMETSGDLLARATAAADRGGSAVASDEQLNDVLIDLFETRLAARRNAEALDVGRRLLDRLGDTVERARFVGRYVVVKADADGSFAEATQLLVDELDRYRPDDGTADRSAEHRAWVGGNLAYLYYRRDELDLALQTAERAIDDARQADCPAAEPAALLYRQAVLGDRGDPDAVPVGDELIAAATAVDDVRVLRAAHNNMGQDAQDGGDWDGARAHYGRSIELCDRIGDSRWAMLPSANLGVLLVDQGRWDEARTELDEIRRLASFYGSGWLAASATWELARLEIHAGRGPEGRRWLAEATEWLQDTDVRSALYEVALLALALDLAEGHSQAVLDGVAGLQPPDDIVARLVGRPTIVTGYALLQRGRADESNDVLEQAVAETSGVSPYGLAQALTGRAEAERMLGRGRSSRRTSAEAQEILDRLGVIELPKIPLPN